MFFKERKYIGPQYNFWAGTIGSDDIHTKSIISF